MTGYDTVPLAEHADRMARVLSVPCPQCHAAPGRKCHSPTRHEQTVQHAARWDAWYAAHPEASMTLCRKCRTRPASGGTYAPAFCAECIDMCHEALEFDHVCLICATPEEARALGLDGGS